MSDGWEVLLDDVSRAQAECLARQRVAATAVSAARGAGIPWSLIGGALGVSKQAAWERFGQQEEPQ